MAAETNVPQVRYIFTHPTSSEVTNADVDRTAICSDIITDLRGDGWLPPPGRSAFAMSFKERTLDLTRSLADQGVPDGGTVAILLPGVGAGEVSSCNA
ncbi:MAG: hypothetical protein ABIO72_02385 [Patescibacteria group bacterium]